MHPDEQYWEPDSIHQVIPIEDIKISIADGLKIEIEIPELRVILILNPFVLLKIKQLLEDV